MFYFPDTLVGTTSPVLKTFAVQNVGTTWSICLPQFSGSNTASFQLVAEFRPKPPAPWDSHSFTIAFSPTVAGVNWAYFYMDIYSGYNTSIDVPAAIDCYGHGIPVPAPAVSLVQPT